MTIVADKDLFARPNIPFSHSSLMALISMYAVCETSLQSWYTIVAEMTTKLLNNDKYVIIDRTGKTVPSEWRIFVDVCPISQKSILMSFLSPW